VVHDRREGHQPALPRRGRSGLVTDGQGDVALADERRREPYARRPPITVALDRRREKICAKCPAETIQRIARNSVLV
jgi:hypothetical protein